MFRLRESVPAKLAVTVGVAAAIAAAIAVGSGDAHADESSYLADLAGHNIPVMIPASAVSDGYRVCREIREGESPQTAAQTFGPYFNVVGPQIVDIARRNLCPDTLQR
ncbi:DUF732 domain-containing protein [Mycobacterium colombiense]